MTPLEQRYRRLLRLLPAGYREQREEEMVDTFLLSMRSGDPVDDEVVDQVGRPGLAERASVLWLAVRLRLEGDAPSSPARREVLVGAVRWWVTSAFLVHAVTSLLLLAGLVWSRLHGVGGADGTWHLSDREWLLVALQVLWIPAFLALVWDRLRAARVLAVMALCVGVLRALSSLTLTIAGREAFWWPSFAALWVIVVADLALVLGLSAFGCSTPARQRRWWCVAAGGLALAVGASWAASVLLGVVVPVLLDDLSVWSLACLGGAVAVWGPPRGASARTSAGPQAGLALLCLTTVLLRVWLVIDLLGVDSWAGWSRWLTGSLVLQLVLPAVIGLVAVSRAFRQARDLVAEPWELEE